MNDNSKRDYCFTAWTEPKYDVDKIRYICWGLEQCPTTNKQHWQGFICLKRTSRVNMCKRIIGAGNDTHVEQRRGSRNEAREYCRKDGEFFEWGIMEKLEFNEILKLNINEIKINYPLMFLRYYKGLEKLNINISPKWRKVDVYILWGAPGTGKTRQVMEMDDVYKLDPPYNWWDGYESQKIILLDDYGIEGGIPNGMLLNICDGYSLRLPVKGSHCWAHWTEVYITSNDDPELWMNSALKRRITSVSMCQGT